MALPSSTTWLGIGVEDPCRGDAHQHLRSGVGQPMAEGDAVIPGVEDEQGNLAIIGQQADQSIHLVDGGTSGIHGRADAQGIEWSVAEQACHCPVKGPRD